MVANGSYDVNAVRAAFNGAVVVEGEDQQIKPKRKKARRIRRLPTKPIGFSAINMPVPKSKLPAKAKRGHLRRPAQDVLVSAFIHTTEDGAKGRKLPGETRRKRNLRTAKLSLADLTALLKDRENRDRISYIEMGQTLAVPRPEVSAELVTEPPSTCPETLRNLHRGGKDVLVGIIDVQGFDFAHPEFLSAGKTRFHAIWDQGLESDRQRGFQALPPRGFDYGHVFDQAALNRAIASGQRIGVPPHALEPQSQMDISSHGTHVASIAAGKSGVCPNATLAAVLISIPKEDSERRKSFYDSTRIVHAVEYLLGVADELGLPVSINISLGTNGHAHDSSSAVSRWIDSELTVPGRAVSVAAGNAGQEVAEFEGDMGYVMGRIHTRGQIPARGLHRDIEWMVAGNGLLDISENELEIWYSPQDRFEVFLKPPGESAFFGPFGPREYVENRRLPGGSFFSIYNELYHPANGCNYISIYLSPFLHRAAIVGVPAGKWVVRLRGLEVRDGNYHGWIERDDPRPLGRMGQQQLWRFPSFFSESSNVDESSVSSLACGLRILSVANLDEAREKINKTSSQGPTRDRRFKPDVAARGTDIVAANGFAGDDLYIKMSGTSMASPYVAGIVALMLAIEPRLTAAQIEGIIQSTAVPLPGANYTWGNDAGFGRINPAACLEEARQAHKRNDMTARARVP